MKFRYVAVDAVGKKVKGVIEAENENNAVYFIHKQDLTPVSVKPYKEKAANFWEMEIMEPDVHKLKMKKKDIMRFADKMSIMLKAGVKLSMAMEVIITSETNHRYRKIFKAVTEDLYAGSSLAESMRKFSAFPEVVVNMVASGEKNGKLDWAFSRIAEMFEKEIALSGKLSAAFTYPLFLVFLMIALFVVMTTYVLPRFSNMYETFDSELPGITQAMINVSDFLIKYGLFIALFIAVAVIVTVVLVKAMPAFRRQLSKLNLHVPVVGRLLVVSNSSSFARIASALIESGVEIVDAMKISATVIKNYHMHQSVVECLDDVRLGAPLHSAFAKLKIFEPLFVSMVEIGEQSSMLDETFGKMADLYEAESNDATRKLTAVIEPVMTMLIGLMIALLVISIILPMFNMYGTILG